MGLAKIFGDNQAGFHTLHAGTPVWMAPEVKTGVYSYPADIYRFSGVPNLVLTGSSLGLVLFELFVGNLTPYWNPTIQGVVLPLNFKAEAIIKPCISPFPGARPTAQQLSQFLDEHMQNLLKTVMNNLTPTEGEHLKAGESEFLGSPILIPLLAALLVSKDSDVSISLLYRHLLALPPAEADEIVNNALKKP